MRLYQEASALNAELEAKVARRTAQLEQSIRQLTAEISEKQQAQSELQKTKAMFSDLFELSPDALFLTNEHGIIERINTQAEILFGYKKVRLLGKPIDKLLPQLFRKGTPSTGQVINASLNAGQWGPTWIYTLSTNRVVNFRWMCCSAQSRLKINGW